jgi:Fusaric acid resistance protein-like
MPDTLHDRRVTSATGSWRAILRAELPQVARIVVAAAVAWEAALLLGATEPPIFAALVPLVSLRDNPFSAFNLSVARLVGVVAGLLIAIGVLAVLEPTTVAIAAVLALALLVGVVLRIGNVLNTQVAVSALLVFSSTDTAGYAVTRLWETGLGTVITLALAPFLFPANPLTAARGELARVAAGLADALRTSTALVEPADDGDRRAVLQRVADDIAGLSADLQRLGPQIASAGKATRWAIVRRSAMRATAELEPTRALAVRLSRDLEVFAAEVSTFSARPAFGHDPMLRPDLLEPLVEPLERAVTAALTGRPYAEDLECAQAAVERFRGVDHSGMASVVRRPLHRMVDDLAAFRP